MQAALKDSGRQNSFYSSISFVIPLERDTPFYVDYMIVLMEFLKRFRGLCELIIIDNGAKEGLLKIIWLYTRLFNRIGSRLRVKFLRNTFNLGIAESVRCGLNMSLGGKVIFILLDHKGKAYERFLKDNINGNEVFSMAEVYFLSGFPSVDYLESIVSS